MRKRKLKTGDYLAIAANLIPVFGVWFQGWSAKEVFIVYAMETFIVGVFTVLKLLIATFYKGKDTWYNQGSQTQVSGLFFIIFFIIHFGLFAVVQTTIFSASADLSSDSNIFYFFIHWYDYFNQDMIFMLCAFIVSYAGRDLFPFVVNGDFKKQSMMRIMFQPYGRIFIQQFIVILGSMFLSFGFDKGFIVVFAGAKIFFEVFIDFNNVINRSMNEMEKESGK